MRADIHDGQGHKALPSTGRIQMRETNYLQIVKSGLHRTAGPYTSIWRGTGDRRRKDGRRFSATMPTGLHRWTCLWSRQSRFSCCMDCYIACGNSGRIAPPIRQDLICDRDSRSTRASIMEIVLTSSTRIRFSAHTMVGALSLVVDGALGRNDVALRSYPL
jgi:hypothetical protein